MSKIPSLQNLSSGVQDSGLQDSGLQDSGLQGSSVRHSGQAFTSGPSGSVEPSRIRREARRLLGHSLLVFGVLIAVSGGYAWVVGKIRGEFLPAFPVSFLLLSVPVSALLYRLWLRFGSHGRGQSWLRGDGTSVAIFADDGLRDHAPSSIRLEGLAKDLTRIGVGLSLLLPLFLHAIFYFGLVLLNSAPLELKGFFVWMVFALLIVGHAHLVLAWMVRRFVRNLVLEDVDKGMLSTIVATTLTAAVPGAIMVVPPILVLVTSCVFVPFLFAWIRGTVKQERLADLERD